MASYIPAYRGYIADVPEVWFKRCDGAIFHFDKITQANVTPQTNFTEVNAGWSLYPVAYLPGQSSMEISMSSGQFDADLFALANGRKFATDSTYKTYMTERLPIVSNTITLTKTPVENSVYIAGLEEDDTAGEGKYAVSTSGGVTTITFSGETGVGDDHIIEVSYETVIEDASVIEIDNKTTAIGDAVFRWPIYTDGTDCTESSIKGYVILHVYRCRVTAMPGFDTSYKSAAVNSVTWAAMEADKNNGEVYSLAYVPKASIDGE